MKIERRRKFGEALQSDQPPGELLVYALLWFKQTRKICRQESRNSILSLQHAEFRHAGFMLQMDWLAKYGHTVYATLKAMKNEIVSEHGK